MYSADNYVRLGTGPRRSAEQIVPLIMRYIQPDSVVDLGCGQGSWLDVFQEHGVSKIIGVDGAWAIPSLQISTDDFVVGDLTQPISIADRFDVAICLEAAHYLPRNTGEVLVSSLVKLAPVVVISAGIPFQSGTTGPNGQWPDYWKDLFEAMDYRLIDFLRPAIWENDDVMYYYKQNLLVFAQSQYVESHPKLREILNASHMPLRLVHPQHYLQKVEYLRDPCLLATMGAKFLFSAFLRACRISLRRRVWREP